MWKQLIVLFCIATLTACGRPVVQQQEAYVFGTRVEVLVVDPDPARGRTAIAAVLREFDRMHRSYHAWQPSELTALNDAIAAGRPHPVSPELAGLIAEAGQLAAQGDYLFDPGIGRLVKLWGFHSDEFKAQLPDPQAIAAWRAARPSISQLTLSADGVARSSNRAVALDFGGYLKGVALDRAATILHAEGIHNALINIGGNILALGDKDGRKWKVGIQHPRQPGPLATVELADGEAIGTSGDYQRFFEVEAQRYPHLLDPRSGYPADHTQAVTVIIAKGKGSGTLSDATSKPLFIAGPNDWQAIASRQNLKQILRVDRSGRIQVTESLKGRLEFVGQLPELEVVR